MTPDERWDAIEEANHLLRVSRRIQRETRPWWVAVVVSLPVIGFTPTATVAHWTGRTLWVVGIGFIVVGLVRRYFLIRNVDKLLASVRGTTP